MIEQKKLEVKLAEMHERNFCVLTSRATSSIYLILKCLLPYGGNVVFPATLCASPVYAALYAFCNPIFCDVDFIDGNINADKLEEIIEIQKIDIILVSHLFGNVANLVKLEEIANKNKILIIEDVAQAMGGFFCEKPLGCFGEASVLSFGHTKILDINYGGAILTDNEELALAVRKIESELPVFDEIYLSKLALDYKKAFYQIREISESSPILKKLFYPFHLIFKDLYIKKFSFKKISKLIPMVENLQSEIDMRHSKAKIYRKLLQHPMIELQHPRPGSVPWRFNIYVKNQKELTSHLRLNGFDASNWYSSVYNFIECPNFENFDGSEKITDSVINLWLDNQTSEKKIHECCMCILDYFENN